MSFSLCDYDQYTDAIQCVTCCRANQFVRCVDDMVSAECGDEIGDKVGELYGRIMADFDCYRRRQYNSVICINTCTFDKAVIV